MLERAVHMVAERRGVLVIPAFAVGRCQDLLFLLRELEDAGRIPTLPLAVDSPMATDVTRIYERHADEMDVDVRRFGERAFRPAKLRFTRSVEESKQLNDEEGPAIIISASGMATGGRVLHHLRRRLPEPQNIVLIVGYQAHGTRGRFLQDGVDFLRIFKEDVPVRATVMRVDAFSAHADANELIEWLRGFSRPPRRTFLVHGEDDARDALALRIRNELSWDVAIPEYGERSTLIP
jgi:metallo-beta-lactamase family protein